MLGLNKEKNNINQTFKGLMCQRDTRVCGSQQMVRKQGIGEEPKEEKERKKEKIRLNDKEIKKKHVSLFKMHRGGRVFVQEGWKIERNVCMEGTEGVLCP